MTDNMISRKDMMGIIATEAITGETNSAHYFDERHRRHEPKESEPADPNEPSLSAEDFPRLVRKADGSLEWQD